MTAIQLLNKTSSIALDFCLVDVDRFLLDERLPAEYAQVIARVGPLAEIIDATSRIGPPLVVGLCGAQGSGKSTMARALCALLQEQGVSCVVLSLDELYLTRAERQSLAKRIHPLLATRGVPGTHDVQLGIELLEALRQARRVALPVFDKAIDDRKPMDEWIPVRGPVQVVLFEGWCVGAIPQDDVALAHPVNALEREHDHDRRWRQFVNDALRVSYQDLFAVLDALILLQAPSFEVVYDWRVEQERKLRDRVALTDRATRVMNDDEVRRFISHFERLTRHILSEMPTRADAVVRLDHGRRPTELIVGGRFAASS